MKSLGTVALGLTIVAVVTLLYPGEGSAYTLEEGFEKVIPRRDASLLDVDNVNGSIHVSSWNKDSVRIEAVKKVKAGSREEAEEWMEELKIEVSRRDGEISVETVYPRRRGWGTLDLIFRRWTKGKVDYKIYVPADIDLSLHTVNGSVEAGKIRGDIRAGTTNGGVHIEEVEGDVRGSTTNGGIEVNSVGGDVEAKSVNGEIKLYEISGSILASTTNGSVRAEVTSLKGDCHISVVNGSISVGLPEDISADVDIKTMNGRIRVELPVQGEMGRRSLRGRIGLGGPLLKLRTVNGNISVEKGLIRKVELRREPACHLRMEFYEEERPWNGLLRYDRVEGLALGLKLSLRQGRDMAYAEGAYGLARRMWTYRFGGEKVIFRGISLGAELHDIVDTQDRWIVSDEEATALMALFGKVTRDYFRRQGYGVGISCDAGKVGRFELWYLGDRYGSLGNVAKWSLLNPKAEKRENPPVDEGCMKSLRMFWSRELPGDGRLEAEGELAGDGLGGGFDFGLLSAEVFWRRELRSSQSLGMRLRLGLGDRELPVQRKFGLGGIGTLRGYDFKEFTGDRMFLIQVEYMLGDGDKALVPFLDAGYAWPCGQSPKLKDIRFDGGIGIVLEGIRLNMAVAPPRKPRWALRLGSRF